MWGTTKTSNDTSLLRSCTGACSRFAGPCTPGRLDRLRFYSRGEIREYRCDPPGLKGWEATNILSYSWGRQSCLQPPFRRLFRRELLARQPPAENRRQPGLAAPHFENSCWIRPVLRLVLDRLRPSLVPLCRPELQPKRSHPNIPRAPSLDPPVARSSPPSQFCQHGQRDPY